MNSQQDDLNYLLERGREYAEAPPAEEELNFDGRDAP